MTLDVTGIEKAFRRRAIDHARELPSQIHRILNAGLQTLPSVRRMHVCGIARNQDSSCSVRGCLPGGVGESREPRGAVGTVVGSIHGDERVAQIVQRGFAVVSHM